MRRSICRTLCCAAIAAVTLAGCGDSGGGDDTSPAASSGQTSPPDLAQDARAAIKGLGEALKAQLVAALQSGGPIPAISVCQSVAPQLAEAKSREHELTVRRTALRVRNPDNAPDDFERAVLEDFVKKIEGGADPAKLEYSSVVTADGAKTFRYMKAIPMAAQPCQVCHGPEIADDLKAEIQRRYPQDQAVGFKTGELRGAFSVSKAVP